MALLGSELAISLRLDIQVSLTPLGGHFKSAKSCQTEPTCIRPTQIEPIFATHLPSNNMKYDRHLFGGKKSCLST